MARTRMVQSQIGFTLAQLEALQTLAEQRQTSSSAIVREALDAYLAKAKEESAEAEAKQLTIESAMKRTKKGNRK